jgi:hypothetical protein
MCVGQPHTQNIFFYDSAMKIHVMPDVERRFLETLVKMWSDPQKRKILLAEGATEENIAEAERKLKELKN